MIGKRVGIAGRWVRIVPAGILGWFLIGCDTPPDIEPIAPPGAQVPHKSPDEEASQALGEMPTAAQAATPTSTETPAPTPPAPPTAKGETKTVEGGVKYETLKEGTGPELKSGQTGQFLYEGKLEDGTVFDSNRATKQPFTTDLKQVVKGWTVGLTGMKVGEVRKLTIPPEMGYGARGAGEKIPPNSTLIFEVELTGIVGQ